MSTDKANRNDAKIQTLLKKLESTEPELCYEIESYIAKEIKLRQDAEAKLVACQEQQKQDEQSLNLIRDEFNKHLQRFELIAESVAIANTEESCPHAINMILDRIGFHMSPKRILVFIDTPDSTMCKVEYQWVAKDVQPFSHNTAINYKECPLWQKMQAEHKMVPGSQLNDLPDDITLILENIGLKNVYMFPLTGNDGTSYGSIMFESYENCQLSKLEIRYIQIVTIVLSGIIHIYRILNDLILEKERAQEADRLKSSFLVNMSHDIRIPLNSIIGFSDLLADEDLTQTDREEFIDLINKSGQDLITLIDNIIDISKIETGQMTVKKEECPLFPLLNDIMAVFKNDRKLEERDNLSLQLDLPPQYAQLKFSTDIFKFRQIYTNLIDNAIKFTDTGCIKFGVSKVIDNTIEFYVQDSGIGISEDQQHIIFQLFGKVDRTYANEYTGTGLGLSICKSLVEMLGGQIYVVSALGKGSTFYFTHPLPEGVSDSLTNTRNVKSPFNWKDRRIVILDNAETDRKYLTHVLSNTGIEIMWMDTPDKAIKFFESNKLADAILIEMSPANIEAAEKIHNISPVPIVVQSLDNQSDEDRQLAMKSGCTEYIIKPLSTTKLLTTIDNLFVKK